MHDDWFCWCARPCAPPPDMSYALRTGWPPVRALKTQCAHRPPGRPPNVQV